ncbi:MAG: TetR/AcrR family transcriptional regulator [Clostridiaceae bacterium]|nr:TetR/AcrR family transcriptional regulator [Clostridiaceae bacterium]
MVRDKIIDAAVIIFSQKGYHSASMDEIAQAAGVAKGSLYYHFHGKAELFTAVICEGIATIRHQVDISLASANDIKDIFTAFITCNLQVSVDYADLTELIMKERIEDWDQEAVKKIKQAKDDYMRYAADLIDQGIQAGLLKNCDSYAAAVAYFSFLYAYFQTARSQGYSLEKITQEATELTMRGLRST